MQLTINSRLCWQVPSCIKVFSCRRSWQTQKTDADIGLGLVPPRPPHAIPPIISMASRLLGLRAIINIYIPARLGRFLSPHHLHMLILKCNINCLYLICLFMSILKYVTSIISVKLEIWVRIYSSNETLCVFGSSPCSSPEFR